MQTHVKVEAWVWLILISPFTLKLLPLMFAESSEGWVPLIITAFFVLFFMSF